LPSKTPSRAPTFSGLSTLLKLSLLFLALPTFLRAQCEKKETTVDLVDCWNAELKKADTELNRVYQAALKKQQPPDAVKLRQAQRTWIGYRDAHCDAVSSLYKGGTIEPMILAHCKFTLTQQRTKEILDSYPVH
jgi:uncharacterized protein YecT (DUF1311 family)